MKNYRYIFLFSFALFHVGLSQSYAPPVGQPGTTAMYKDSSAFVNWAKDCQVQRGYQDISTPSLGLASVGDASLVVGVADISVLSLGDGGSAICEFPFLIMNGPGPDFAVFENSFDDQFLELAFVEVSSDGVNFFRFPSHSLTDTSVQTASFGATDATKINNLAGKYRGGYGTPFDLQDLADKAGLDVSAIAYVKIVDVVGAIDPHYATRDSYHNKVNDPWPTAFASGGFDLDAVGVIHQSTIMGIAQNKPDAAGIIIYPNPVRVGDLLKVNYKEEVERLELADLAGNTVAVSDTKQLEIRNSSSGVYVLKIRTAKGIVIRKICIQ